MGLTADRPVRPGPLPRLCAVVAGAGVALLAALVPAPAFAEARETAIFDLQLRGLRAGMFGYSAVVNDSAYAVNGRLESTGLIAAIRKFRYVAKAEGRVMARGLVPRRYEEVADTGRRQSTALMTYRNGVPTVHDRDPERAARPWALDPAEQHGTLDPLSALYAALRDVPPGEACSVTLDLFDGDRRTRLTLGAPENAGATVTCAGEYRRIAGYSPEDLEDKSRFPFLLIYEPAGDDRLRVREVRLDTVYGQARLRRR